MCPTGKHTWRIFTYIPSYCMHVLNRQPNRIQCIPHIRLSIREPISIRVITNTCTRASGCDLVTRTLAVFLLQCPWGLSI